jgi:hypothetical protein
MPRLRAEVSPMTADTVCCFCGLGIEENASEPIVMRLGGRHYLSDFDREKQVVCSHLVCLEERLHPSVPFLPELFHEEGDVH